MTIWILSITCVLLVVAVVFLLIKKSASKKAMVGSIVTSLIIGAGGGNLMNRGEGWAIDQGKDSNTIFITDSDYGKQRPNRAFGIDCILKTGQTAVLAYWIKDADSTKTPILVWDYVYTKTTPCDSGKATMTDISIIFEDR